MPTIQTEKDLELTLIGHRISWWVDDDSVTKLDESDTEHIQGLLAQGYVEGEIVHGENSIRGWWKKT